jgi:hypothetical protein
MCIWEQTKKKLGYVNQRCRIVDTDPFNDINYLGIKNG